MLDEIFDVVIDEVAKLVPDVVWGAIFLVTGALVTMTGVTMVLGMTTLNGSVRLGGLLTAVGLLLIAGPLVTWYR
ncbi:hypothetical protein R3751_13840 [Halorubrum distributum]|uniref:Uncharacterized protein n=1 Tax=Halorubrum distributum JCM 10247 TaxID=1227486 RepID=M0DBS4_9EURY|nr:MULTISPECIES: hypothetical protein [Halorubrum distributum group]ELZ32248.1 hypothetical protein C473_09547 [Halorubrum terrestre JCM 10247]MDV7350857.1 hypothetical protein [Halorubrum distributum]